MAAQSRYREFLMSQTIGIKLIRYMKELAEILPCRENPELTSFKLLVGKWDDLNLGSKQAKMRQPQMGISVLILTCR